MLNKQGFNLWAEDYDKTLQVSEENNLYLLQDTDKY